MRKLAAALLALAPVMTLAGGVARTIAPPVLSQKLPPGCATTFGPGGTLKVNRALAAYWYDSAAHSCDPHVARVGSDGMVVLEAARTNVVLRSNTIDPATYATAWLLENSGAAAPTITAATTDLLAPDGTQSATKVALPAVGAGQYSLVRSANFTATAAPWSGSLWLRTASGTATVYLWFSLAGSSNVFATCAVSTAWVRCLNQNRTLTAASWGLRFGVDARDGQATQSAQTVYVWQAQAEAGATSTSDIVTAGSTVQRPADAVAFVQ